MSSRAGTAADDQFYREYILDHYKNPRNFGRLENPDISHEEDNPLCGDVIGMDFRVKNGVIEDIKFHGRGCAISQASASLLTERLKGLPLEEAKEDRQGRRARRAGDRHLTRAHQVRPPFPEGVEGGALWIGCQ